VSPDDFHKRRHFSNDSVKRRNNEGYKSEPEF
jgi:hypothetical protein